MVADLFHFGHVNFLRQAREHGDYLLVGIHGDEVVENYKRMPILRWRSGSLQSRAAGTSMR